jgi:cation diffusion facilitator family transporter
MADCCDDKSCELEKLAGDADQRRVLTVVLALNATMFAVEFGAGLAAGSVSLMADSVDMLGDALVYGLSLYALARGARWKAGAALAKGGFILLFGLGVLIEVALKLTNGVPPSSAIMLGFGGLALVANLTCLGLLWRYRTRDVNMSSTFECSRNDVIANVGVLVAAGGVAIFHAPWPDILVGAAIAAVFLRSAVRVIGQSWPILRAPPASAQPRFVISPRRNSNLTQCGRTRAVDLNRRRGIAWSQCASCSPFWP